MKLLVLVILLCVTAHGEIAKFNPRPQLPVRVSVAQEQIWILITVPFSPFKVKGRRAYVMPTLQSTNEVASRRKVLGPRHR